jgi:hypothetical protein
MKICLTVVILLILTGWVSASPAASADTELAKLYRLDFAVPDLPAFNLLGTQPDQILRPSSLRELALLASDFDSAQHLFLPRSLALEIAPYMLARASRMTLQDYDKHRVLYSLRVSVGTARTEAETAATKIAGGVRVTLVDAGDLNNDSRYRQHLGELLDESVRLKDSAQQKFLDTNHYSMGDVLHDSLKRAALDSFVEARTGRRTGQIEDSFQNLKQYYKAANWNKWKWDVAVAALLHTPESLARDAKFDRAAAWMTLGIPVCSGGQLLVGYNTSYCSDTVWYWTHAVSCRAYAGANRVKGFTELQGSYSGMGSSWDGLWNSGAELNLIDGVWIDLSAGLEYSDFTKSSRNLHLISGFHLRLAMPEKFNLF